LVGLDVFFEIVMICDFQLIARPFDPFMLLGSNHTQKLFNIQVAVLFGKLIENLLSFGLFNNQIVDIQLLHDFLKLTLIN
jgi:hypothetical protein